MAHENIIGQHRVKSFFQKAFEGGRLSHAYLFAGERGVGKEATALELAKALICGNKLACQTDGCTDCTRIAKLNYPDLKIIFPAPAKQKEEEAIRVLASIAENPYNRLEPWANPMISIERIRELRRVSSFKSYEGKGRVVIIFDSERLTTEAANSLLKILEEPPEEMHLILTSSQPGAILPTISSRCQLVRFDPLSTAEIEQALLGLNAGTTEEIRLIARVAAGSYRRAIELLDEDLQHLQQEALEFFRKSVQSEFVQIAYVEDILHSFQRDLKKVQDLLRLLSFWFRDATIYRETKDQGNLLLVNVDEIDVLENFTKKFPNADLHGAVSEIEKSLEFMGRNVQVNLILIVLLNRLRSYLKRT